MKQQSGFTLIELIMVIVILGILAATAMPKFVDLKSDAEAAATKGVGGALAAAAAINYGSRQLGKGVAITNCTSMESMLEGGVLPTGYDVASTVIAAGSNVTCTVTGPGSTSATFTATGIN